MRNPDEAFRLGVERQIAELDAEIASCKQRLVYLRQAKGEALARLAGSANESPIPEHMRRSM